jgi:plastocyanin
MTVNTSLVRLAPIAAIAALCVALVRVVAAADSSASPAPAASASAPSAASSAAAAKTVGVKIENFAYSPDPVTIPVGTKVVFTEEDSTSHTVTSADGSPPLFDSGNLDQHQSWSHIFAKAGTYKYFCRYHTYMTGTIVVK